MSQKSRATLIDYFEAGNMPTAKEFADLVDSALNKNDDQLTVKTQGIYPNEAKYLGIGAVDPRSPLSIRAHGQQEQMLSFEDLKGNETWRIHQKVGDKQGLNIAEVNKMESQLFIQSETGNIGIESTDPRAKLEVNGVIYSRDQKEDDNGTLYLGHNGQGQGATIQYLRSQDHLGFKTASGGDDHLVIKNDGKVGVNTMNPDTHLHVNGMLTLQEGVPVNSFSTDSTFSSNSDQVVPTEKAIKAYIRYHIRDDIWSSEINKNDKITIHSVTNSTSWINMPDMNMTISTSGRPVLVFFKASDVQAMGVSLAHAEFRILVNGVQEAYCMHEFHHNGWELRDVSMTRLLTPRPGTHTLVVQWSIRSPYSSNVMLGAGWYQGNRNLIAVEI